MGDIKFEQLVKKFSPKIKHLVLKVIINNKSIDKDDLFQKIVYHLSGKDGEMESLLIKLMSI